MRALIILLLFSQATSRRGGSSRGRSRGSSSKGSSWGKLFSWGSRSRTTSYSTSPSTNYKETHQSSPSYQKQREKEIARQKLAESYVYGGENWHKLSHSKPKVPAVIPVVFNSPSHSHSTGNNGGNKEASNSEKSSVSKYLFGTSSFSVSLILF